MDYEKDELEKLENKVEIFAPEGTLEAPAKEFVPGPYYAAVDEIMPELAQHNNSVDVESEVKTDSERKLPVDRRDFMRLFSASAMFGASACVRRPAETAIPYVDQPTDLVPGVPTYYASTCGGCASACGVVVKTREGRPVKLEGSQEHPINMGGLCGLGQASIQGLYHPERIKGPKVRYGKRLDDVSWKNVYQEIADKLGSASNIGILTGGSTGNRHGFFKRVLENMGSSVDRLYTWDSNGLYSSIAKAHEIAFGVTDLPRADLNLAETIVGIGSDFLDVGTSPSYHAKSFARSHGYKSGKMGLFIQFESGMSLTGSAADKRHIIDPGTETLVALLLAKSLYENSASKGSTGERRKILELFAEYDIELSTGYKKVGVTKDVFDELAQNMLSKPSVLMAGGSGNFDHNSTNLQLAAIVVNVLIGAYGKSLLLDAGWMKSPVKPGDMTRFMKDAPELEALIVIDCNPVFSTPKSFGLDKLLEAIPTVISIQDFPNEVDEFAEFILPNHHYLESWGDEEPVAGFWSMRQPSVRGTTDSRQAEDSLLWILAEMDKSLPYRDYQAFLKEQWKKIASLVGSKIDYDVFVKAILRRGFIGKPESRTLSEMASLKGIFDYSESTVNGLVLMSPLDHRLRDGQGAHLPVLQEIGDGLSTIAWDSWVSLNPNTMKQRGIKQNQLLKIETSEGALEVAAYPMPGLHPRAVVIHRGNGHIDKQSTISNGVGVNPLDLYGKKVDLKTGQPVTVGEAVKISSTGSWYRLAAMQKHNDIANRKDIVKKITLEDAKKVQFKKQDLDKVPDMFPKLEEAEHRWGMSIDLDKCTGCGACMVACSMENNVPQVGREQILLGREMHWIRLDRYFYGDVNEPVVTFQPVMCQHCNHAPCEAVCPVFATTHDPEGLNAMTYNRCVGTRYCGNACPYKVRRFNWWTHKWGEMGQRPQDRNPRALNPDVTVRTRGVMEKCSFCVGRLREARHTAKIAGRPLYDGEAKTACQQTCPSEAITFGNLHDPKSKISRARKDYRSYLMLGGDPEHGHFGLKTLPNVSYMADVTHEKPATGFGPQQDHHGSDDHG